MRTPRVGQLYARWDGKGVPALKGDDIALPMQVVSLAQDTVTFHRVAGLDAARAMGASHGQIIRRHLLPFGVAEIERALDALNTDRLTDCTLYVTIEPCAQCAGAIVLAKVGTLVFGAYDEKAGMCGSVGDLVRHPRLNHRVDVQSGVEAEACAELIKEFFAAKRA